MHLPEDSELTHLGQVMHLCISKLDIIIPPHTTKLLGGYIGFTPSVRPSRVRPASRVRSVASTVLVGSISYLYIL